MSTPEQGPDKKKFDRLMRGLIAVPKDELEAEMRKDEKKKAKTAKPKPKK